MVGVILAAGNGIRFNNNAGAECCKVLERIDGIPLIGYSLDIFVAIGVDRITIVVGKHESLIRTTIGCEYRGIPISYVRQEKQIGLANALLCAVKTMDSGEDVLLLLADELYIGLKADSIQAAMTNPECSFFAGITYEDDPNRIQKNYSIELSGISLKRCVEKPTVIENNMKGTGLCFFDHFALCALADRYDARNNFPNDLCDCFNYLLSIGITGFAVCVAEKEFNINTASDFNEAKAFFGNFDDSVFNQASAYGGCNGAFSCS